MLRLWESLWTDFYSSSSYIFIVLAILERHRGVIMARPHHFDEVLKYINDLSGTMDFELTLVRAESLHRHFQRTVETIDKKDNFPTPPGAATEVHRIASRIPRTSRIVYSRSNFEYRQREAGG